MERARKIELLEERSKFFTVAILKIDVTHCAQNESAPISEQFSLLMVSLISFRRLEIIDFSVQDQDFRLKSGPFAARWQSIFPQTFSTLVYLSIPIELLSGLPEIIAHGYRPLKRLSAVLRRKRSAAHKRFHDGEP